MSSQDSMSSQDAMLSGDDHREDDDAVSSVATEEEQHEEPAAVSVAAASAPFLSKSWSIQTSHAPLYTGGKLTLADSLLWLPVHDNLVVVDAATAVIRGRVRQDDVNDEDDEGLDPNAITAYALAPNHQVLLTCSQNSLLRQYRIRENDVKDSVTIELDKNWGRSGHALPVTHLQFHSSSIFLSTGSVDGSVRVWDVRGGFPTHVFAGAAAVTALQWQTTPHELILAIGRHNGSISIHNLRHANVVVLENHISAVTGIDWNPSGTCFISTGRDQVLNLWSIENAQEEPTRKSKKKKKPSSKIGEAASDKYRRSQTLPVYEQVEGMVLLPAQAHRNDVVVATAGSKGRVRLFQLDTTCTPPQLKLLAEQPETECFGEARGGYLQLQYVASVDDCDDGTSSGQQAQEQLVVADAEHNVSFLSLSGNKLLETQRTIVGHNDDILDIKVLPNINNDGAMACPRRIVVATNSAQVRLFELDTFACTVLDRHTATVLCVDVSPCGRFVATCGKDQQMRLWDVAQQVCVAVAVGHTEAVGSTALSRKPGRYNVSGKAAKNGAGAFVVTVSMDRTLKRWNLPGAGELGECAQRQEEIALKAFASTRAHEKDINIVTIAPNDSLIATGSQDKTVKLWKATDLSLQATLKGHRRGVWDCQFSPYDRVLATGSGDKTIKLWSLGDYSCVRTFQGHVASVLRVRFLSGGLQLVSSGADGLVKLWTIRTNECEATMDGHNDKVWALDLAPGGKTLVSGGADSQIVVWDDTTQQVESAKRAEEEEVILMDQRLANHLRHKEYGEALELSLKRDKPHQALKVLVAIIENDLQKGEKPLESLQRHTKEWSMEQVTQVLRCCREWNTRARNSQIALLVVKAIVTSFPAHELAATDGLPEILAGIVPYAERHFDRLDRLHASSYLLDFALFAMGSLDAVEPEQDFATWKSKSKLVLPPKEIDGRVQVGGKAVVGGRLLITSEYLDEASDEDDEEVLTVGDSDSSDEEMET